MILKQRFLPFSRCILLALVSCLWIAGCSNNEKADTQQLDKHLARANNYLNQHQYKAAFIEAQNANRIAPDNPKTHIILAKIYNAVQQPDQAIKTLTEIKASQDIAYVSTLSQAYLLKGKSFSALALLDKQPPPLNTELQLMRSQALAGTGKLDEALAGFREVLKQDSSNAEAKLNIAKIEVRQGKTEQAKADIEALLKSDPENKQALFFQANLLAADNQLDKAESILTRLISLLPNSDISTPIRTQTIQALIDVLTRQGRSSEAYMYSQLLKESVPAAALQLNSKMKMALGDIKENKLDDAAQLLSEILDEAPDNEFAGTMLGTVKYLQGDMKVANQYFEKFLDVETAPKDAIEASALTHLQLNQPDQVLSSMGPYIDSIQSPQLLAIYAAAAQGTGKAGLAMQVMDRAIKLAPDSIQINLAYAGTLNAQTPPQYQAALEALLHAHKLKPDNLPVQAATLKQYELLGRPEDADKFIHSITANKHSIDSYVLASRYYLSRSDIRDSQNYAKQAIKIAPDNAGAALNYANVSLAAHDNSDARSAYLKVISLQPETIDAYRGLITTYERQKQADKGVNAVIEIAGQQPQEYAPRQVLAEYYTLHGKFDQAQKYLNSAQQLQPDNHNLSLLQAKIYTARAHQALSESNADEARTWLLKALQQEPNTLPLLVQLTQLEIQTGRFTEAGKLIDQIAKLDTDSPTSGLLKAAMLDKQGQQDAALKQYRTLWSEFTDARVATPYLRYLEQRGDNKQVGETLQQWRQAQPNAAGPIMLQAMQAQKQGDTDKATELYLEFIKKAPRSAYIALNNLAWIYQQKGDDRALATAEAAYKAAPKDHPGIMDTYGWILAQHNQFAKGIDLLKHAQQLAPDNKEISRHLQQAIELKDKAKK